MTFLFLSARLVHVLLAGLWFGSAAFMSLLLMPAMNAAGPSAGPMMISLNRKGLVPFFASISGITILTGFYLYWHATDGFAPGSGAQHANMAYGAGGIAGLIAAILGGSVVGRSAKKAVEIMGRVATLGDGSEKQALMGEVAALREKMATFGMIVVVLQVVAASLMAMARFI